MAQRLDLQLALPAQGLLPPLAIPLPPSHPAILLPALLQETLLVPAQGRSSAQTVGEGDPGPGSLVSTLLVRPTRRASPGSRLALVQLWPGPPTLVPLPPTMRRAQLQHLGYQDGTP